jgi:hypothetical protein
LKEQAPPPVEPIEVVEYETTVKRFVEDSPSEWISCAVVYLYDRDRLSRDDFLGMDITDSYGEAHFRFDSSQFLDLDDRIGGTLPELFVKIFGRDDRLMLSTRAGAARNQVPTLLRVGIPRALAKEHGLL